MSYSRRQLEAFGEPLGDSVTRKEGGRIIYGGGGSSAPSTTTQTQISELPDWAKPYAQETLEKGKALSNAPYQAYSGDRIAGFSPLQEQAQTAAAKMGPSRFTQAGGRAAGAATLGALGTDFTPFRMGEFTSNRAAQYMNPFIEGAMEPQLREAQRSSEMQRAADQAQAVRAGAFGGSRQGIVEAERQRNLGTQLGDIRARGYQTAFDQAQQNFAREQQLREQSRQYGTGARIQGLQTAIQGASQLGAIGGQEFGQGLEANKLQQQVGAQQQALQQQGLTQAYQDFLNQQNYPYKQLGFMSDLIRGLPLGQQSTAQVYQPPGNLAGQVAGIGMGAYGLSRAFGGFAEGGEVDEYAEGGVTGDRNVDSILDGLSDLQLQQAKVAALDRGDKQRVDMIDAELAQRASLRAGLGNAFDSLPPESQESVFSAASGGMVAFAGGGDVDPFAQFSGMDPAAYAASVSTDEVRRQSILNRRKAEEDQQRIEFLRTAAPEVAARMEKERKAPAAPATAPAAVPYDRATATRREDFRAPPRESGFSKREASNAVNTIVQAAKVQVPEDRTEELANTLYSQMMARTKADRDSFRAELEAVKGRAKEIEARGIGEAFAKYGFGIAAAAAKSGRRQGVAGVIEAAATASPLLAESLAETQKLKAAAQDNYMKMRVENARYESAVDQGNMQLAATLANNIGQRKLQQATLQEQIAQHERMYGLEKEKLGIQRAQAGKQGELRSIASELMAEDPSLTRKSALQEASRIAGYSFRTDAATGGKLASELRKIDEEFSTLKFLDPKSKMAENLAAQRQQRISEAYRLYGTDQPGGVTSAQPPAAGAGQMRIVGVR
jgi:hypothetical protein